MDPKSGFNFKTDLLIVNDLQKSFLQYGELENSRAEEITPGIKSLLYYFPPKNVYLFYHYHPLEKFQDLKTRHSVIYKKIDFVVMEGNEVVKRDISEEGKSIGAELEPGLEKYRKHQLEISVRSSFIKCQCPLLGENFSVIQYLKLSDVFKKNGIKRIFFCGLNLDPCIKNEIDYLLDKK